jgi:methylated-DNA-[protein]-cysteine S-methyltransferase
MSGDRKARLLDLQEGSMSSEQLTWTAYESPLGRLTLIASPAGIREVRFPGRSGRLAKAAHRRMPQAEGQLTSYFAGERRDFELELDLRGAALQRLVWEQLMRIPYGATTTYGELAQRVDASVYPDGLATYKRARLIGAAVGRTPTPILLPCHRVIGADGSLTGYGGGLPRKQALLDLEGGRTAAKTHPPNLANRQLALL